MMQPTFAIRRTGARTEALRRRYGLARRCRRAAQSACAPTVASRFSGDPPAGKTAGHGSLLLPARGRAGNRCDGADERAAGSTIATATGRAAQQAWRFCRLYLTSSAAIAASAYGPMWARHHARTSSIVGLIASPPFSGDTPRIASTHRAHCRSPRRTTTPLVSG